MDQKKWLWGASYRLFQKLGPAARSQCLLDEAHFPRYHVSENASDILYDLASHLGFPSARFRVEIAEDIRDTYGIPYVMAEPPRDVEIGREGPPNGFAAFIAKSVSGTPGLVVPALYAMAGLKLEEAIEEALGGKPPPKALVELAAVHMGCGAILLEMGNQVDIRSDNYWVKTRTRKTVLPPKDIAYALAACFDKADLLPLLAPDFVAAALITAALEEYAGDVANPDPAYADARLQFRLRMWRRSSRCAGAARFAEQIPFLRAAHQASPQDEMRGAVSNNLGYALLRNGDLEAAAPYLTEAVALLPDAPYARNNLCLLHLLRAERDPARGVLRELADLALGNEYTERNRGLLAMLDGDHVAAERHFQAALESGKSIDLLDACLSRFYAKVGDASRSERHLERARAAHDLLPEAGPR